MARRAGSGGAAGAGAQRLNLSEAKGRDVSAVPTLPVWPGSYPQPRLVAHLYAPYAPPPGVGPARAPASSNDGNPRSRLLQRSIVKISVLVRRLWAGLVLDGLASGNYRRGRIAAGEGFEQQCVGKFTRP
jgi:hypothetical protein